MNLDEIENNSGKNRSGSGTDGENGLGITTIGSVDSNSIVTEPSPVISRGTLHFNIPRTQNSNAVTLLSINSNTGIVRGQPSTGNDDQASISVPAITCCRSENQNAKKNNNMILLGRNKIVNEESAEEKRRSSTKKEESFPCSSSSSSAEMENNSPPYLADAARDGGPVVQNREDVSGLTEQVASLKTDLTYLTHQVYRILLSLHVPPCACTVCEDRHAEQNEIIIQSTKAQHPPASKLPGTPHSEGEETGADHMEYENSENVDGGAQSDGVMGAIEQEYDTDESCDTPSAPFQNNLTNGGLSTDLMESAAEQWLTMRRLGLGTNFGNLIPPIGNGVMGNQGGGVIRRRGRGRGGNRHHVHGAPGRRSKYCTASEKAAVAEYASVHGATAAARKFNIPPAVAAYYHRKLNKTHLTPGRRPTLSPNEEGHHHHSFLDESGNGLDGVSHPDDHQEPNNDAANSRYADSDLSMGETDGNEVLSGIPVLNRMDSAGFSAGLSKNHLLTFPHPASGLHISSAVKSRPPLSSGGKGRGRPKLIGDQLDGELLDYLASLYRGTRDHWNAERVLRLSTQFVTSKQPTLLVEYGGTVSLKLTWAQKMLLRVKELIRMEEQTEDRRPSIEMDDLSAMAGVGYNYSFTNGVKDMESHQPTMMAQTNLTEGEKYNSSPFTGSDHSFAKKSLETGNTENGSNGPSESPATAVTLTAGRQETTVTIVGEQLNGKHSGHEEFDKGEDGTIMVSPPLGSPTLSTTSRFRLVPKKSVIEKNFVAIAPKPLS